MRRLYYILAFAAVALFTACENDDTDFGGIIDETGGASGYVPRSVEFDRTPLSENAESFPDDDNDYEENTTFFYQVDIHFDGNTATVGGDDWLANAEVDGAHVTVNSSVKNVMYVLSGSSDNGSFQDIQ